MSSSNSTNGPKLFTNKPKKSKLKSSSPNPISMPTPASESKASAAPTTSAPPPPPRPPTASAPPPPPPKESFVRRYRFMWPLVLGVNFAIGAYVLLRTTKKSGTKESDITDTPSSTPSSLPLTVSNTINENPVSNTPLIEHVQRPPIPQDQQRELFKWILEEKRKIKPRDAEEKKRIDEEKALLKQFIRGKTIPDL